MSRSHTASRKNRLGPTRKAFFYFSFTLLYTDAKHSTQRLAESSPASRSAPTKPSSASSPLLHFARIQMAYIVMLAPYSTLFKMLLAHTGRSSNRPCNAHASRALHKRRPQVYAIPPQYSVQGKTSGRSERKARFWQAQSGRDQD